MDLGRLTARAGFGVSGIVYLLISKTSQGVEGQRDIINEAMADADSGLFLVTPTPPVWAFHPR